MGDDIGMWNIGAYHRGMMAGKTPNLDRMAKESMLFTDYYAEEMTFTAWLERRRQQVAGHEYEVPVQEAAVRFGVSRSAKCASETATIGKSTKLKTIFVIPKCNANWWRKVWEMLTKQSEILG
jgi:hypothetical protein